MAVNASTAWEFRASTGSATNGGGFADLNPGTSVDYSQQAASQLSLTDITTSGIGSTTITSATGGFTAAMEGNVAYLHTGTNLTDGWYQLTGYTDTNNMTVDRAPDDGVGGVSGGDCEVGGALDILTDTFLDDTNVVDAGNRIWVKNDGTMTLTGAIVLANAGTELNWIKIIGYNSSRGDNPTGSNRPLIACAANSFELAGSFWSLENVRVTITTANGVQASRFVNVASNNSSGTGSRYAIVTVMGGASAIGCDAQSVNGRAVYANSSIRCIGCYIHDSVDGGFCVGTGQVFVSCVFDTCSGEGIGVNLRDDVVAVNCTFYNCGIGVSGDAGSTECVLFNNIFDACTTGVSFDADRDSNFGDYNCWDNTTDVTNFNKGDNAVTGDPGLTDPANGDFSIGSGSNCVNAALDVGDLTDATV